MRGQGNGQAGVLKACSGAGMDQDGQGGLNASMLPILRATRTIQWKHLLLRGRGMKVKGSVGLNGGEKQHSAGISAEVV